MKPEKKPPTKKEMLENPTFHVKAILKGAILHEALRKEPLKKPEKKSPNVS
jgi:hypothetical protein